MLTLSRLRNQWTKVVHAKTGDVLSFLVALDPNRPGQFKLVFDDDAHNFEIERPERKQERPVIDNRRR